MARCQDFGGATRYAPPKSEVAGNAEIGRDARNAVRPEEDALTRLFPYHGLGSKDASEGIWGGGRRGTNLLGGKGQKNRRRQSTGTRWQGLSE